MPSNLPTGLRNKLDAERVPAGGGAWRLLTFMIFVFAVFLVSYFGLILGYKNFVLAQIEGIDKEIETLAAQVPKEQQEEFLKFQFQLINLQNILNSHVFASKIFPLIEANTNKQVYYTSLEADVSENRINIGAVASSYKVLAEQLAALERLPEVINYKVDNARTGEGGQIQFNVSLTLSPKVFRSE